MRSRNLDKNCSAFNLLIRIITQRHTDLTQITINVPDWGEGICNIKSEQYNDKCIAIDKETMINIQYNLGRATIG